MPDTGGRSPAQVGRQIGGVWTVQLVQVVVQFLYAAVTARLIDPAGFGDYAVALAVFALLGLVAVLGLGNAAARRPDDDERADRLLVSHALALGSVMAVVVGVGAGALSWLWAAPSATDSVRLISLAIAFLPWSTVLTGILRRQGRIRELNMATLAAGLLSIGFGLPVVWVAREPWALVVTPVVNQLFLTVLFTRWLGRRSLPVASLRGATQDVAFGAKSMTLSAVNQIAYYVPLWTLSRFTTPAVFGSWNRAVVVGQLPLESATRAAVTVVFPFFRHPRRDPASERQVWTDMLGAAALVVLPVSGVAMPLMPAAVTFLLGDQWSVAGSMAVWLWAAAAVTVLRTLLGSALESSNTFGPLWASQSIIAAVYVFAALAIWQTANWTWFAVSLVVGAVAAHTMQILAARSTVDIGPLLRWYAVAVGGAMLGALVSVGITRLGVAGWVDLVFGAGVVAGFLGALWWRRRGIAPFVRLGLTG